MSDGTKGEGRKPLVLVLPLRDRAQLAWEQLVMRDEEVRAQWDDGMGVTDSDVLDVIDAWTVEEDAEDYASLSALIWCAVENANQN